ncbi:hypothetical protein JM93_01456 [Roseibium hamelinense]|uniref:Uncharacterized protein n=1 Tax=Roseibium hamelinense TaxID=150831 RepID=A0A562TB17_9HYPH|nr:hypothetical protein [Roseibium hamelinense]TWI90474.1 hypothetical protein JM93_01456 [Roseibium hamelinense]
MFRLLISLSFLAGATLPALSATGERVQITGEVIDTWCYYSGVMGGPDAVTGTAHHTCALWCAAGGIPVGMLTEDGKVYMVLKWEGHDQVGDGKTLLSVQSHKLVADGIHYERDGIDYILVENIVSDEGITLRNHEDYGFVPPFAEPGQ